jgi:predicted transcriptional regulator
MRTTIELSEENRARVLELAARRGEKGFSSVINDAVEAYLKAQLERQESLARALAARGALSDEEANALRAHVRKLRREWR